MLPCKDPDNSGGSNTSNDCVTVGRIESGWLQASVSQAMAEQTFTQITLEVWFKPDRISGGQALIAWGYPKKTLVLGLVDDQYRFGNASLYVSSPIEMPTLGGWHFVAAVCDGANMMLYPGGLPARCKSGSRMAGCQIKLGNAIALGAIPHAKGMISSGFSGEIAHARIWTQARTGEEIQTDMSTQPTQCTPLVADWPFDEAKGAVAKNRAGDAVGNAKRQGYNAGYRIVSIGQYTG